METLLEAIKQLEEKQIKPHGAIIKYILQIR